MKTTHQLAKELLSLPDVELVIEGWCQMSGYELTADMTEYDPDGTAILYQKCVDEEKLAAFRELAWMEEHTINFPNCSDINRP